MQHKFWKGQMILRDVKEASKHLDLFTWGESKEFKEYLNPDGQTKFVLRKSGFSTRQPDDLPPYIVVHLDKKSHFRSKYYPRFGIYTEHFEKSKLRSKFITFAKVGKNKVLIREMETAKTGKFSDLKTLKRAFQKYYVISGRLHGNKFEKTKSVKKVQEYMDIISDCYFCLIKTAHPEKEAIYHNVFISKETFSGDDIKNFRESLQKLQWEPSCVIEEFALGKLMVKGEVVSEQWIFQKSRDLGYIESFINEVKQKKDEGSFVPMSDGRYESHWENPRNDDSDWHGFSSSNYGMSGYERLNNTELSYSYGGGSYPSGVGVIIDKDIKEKKKLMGTHLSSNEHYVD